MGPSPSAGPPSDLSKRRSRSDCRARGRRQSCTVQDFTSDRRTAPACASALFCVWPRLRSPRRPRASVIVTTNLAVRRVAQRLWRRQDDHGAARPADPSLRNHRNRQRELALQTPRLSATPACPGGQTGTSRASLRQTRRGHSTTRGPLLFATGTKLSQRRRGVPFVCRSGVPIPCRLTRSAIGRDPKRSEGAAQNLSSRSPARQRPLLAASGSRAKRSKPGRVLPACLCRPQSVCWRKGRTTRTRQGPMVGGLAPLARQETNI